MASNQINVKAYTDWMNTAVVETTENISKEFLYNLWDEVVLGNPVVTGLSKFSWRMTPDRKSWFKPELPPYSGFERVFPDPERPNLDKYKRIHKTFVLFNNQEYVVNLNEDNSKPYYQFIENGIDRAKLKTKF